MTVDGPQETASGPAGPSALRNVTAQWREIQHTMLLPQNQQKAGPDPSLKGLCDPLAPHREGSLQGGEGQG